jgi:4-oxalocrotonate tautomerase family enzyme
MPLVEMYFGKGALTDEQKADLSRKVTDLIVKEAKQPQHYTWVIIHEIPGENWMVDRLTLPELKAKLMTEKEVRNLDILARVSRVSLQGLSAAPYSDGVSEDCNR